MKGVPTLLSSCIHVFMYSCTGNIFRCTTGENPTVLEIPINQMDVHRRPIAIKADPRPNMLFMWFSAEGGHSVCRLDTTAFEKEWVPDKNGKGENNCVCSLSW